MSLLIFIGIVLPITLLIAILWLSGIDYMKENHPDYKGEDFLNTSSGRDAYDDNKTHTEEEF